MNCTIINLIIYNNCLWWFWLVLMIRCVNKADALSAGGGNEKTILMGVVNLRNQTSEYSLLSDPCELNDAISLQSASASHRPDKS